MQMPQNTKMQASFENKVHQKKKISNSHFFHFAPTKVKKISKKFFFLHCDPQSKLHSFVLLSSVHVTENVVEEIKRIIEESEIMEYVFFFGVFQQHKNRVRISNSGDIVFRIHKKILWGTKCKKTRPVLEISRIFFFSSFCSTVKTTQHGQKITKSVDKKLKLFLEINTYHLLYVYFTLSKIRKNNFSQLKFFVCLTVFSRKKHPLFLWFSFQRQQKLDHLLTLKKVQILMEWNVFIIWFKI